VSSQYYVICQCQFSIVNLVLIFIIFVQFSPNFILKLSSFVLIQIETKINFYIWMLYWYFFKTYNFIKCFLFKLYKV